MCHSLLHGSLFLHISQFFSQWIKKNLLFTVAHGASVGKGILQQFQFHRVKAFSTNDENSLSSEKCIKTKFETAHKPAERKKSSAGEIFFITLIYLTPGNWFTSKGSIWNKQVFALSRRHFFLSHKRAAKIDVSSWIMLSWMSYDLFRFVNLKVYVGEFPSSLVH